MVIYLNRFWLCMTQYYWQCNNERILTLPCNFSYCLWFFFLAACLWSPAETQHLCLCFLFSCLLSHPKLCYLNLDHILGDFQDVPIHAVWLWFPILWFYLNWCSLSLWSRLASWWELSKYHGWRWYPPVLSSTPVVLQQILKLFSNGCMSW